MHDMYRGQIIRRDRIRRVPKTFSWVDHRLVRKRRIDGRTPQALALYLFLLTVADADGLSWWGEAAIMERLGLDQSWFRTARAELESSELIAYRRPVYQVLDLGGAS